MARAILCVGNYAKTPYYVEKAGVHVYSVEELCYLLAEHVFLIDRDIVNKKLASWIKEECGLEDLGTQLYSIINHKGKVSAFVSAILNYTGYFDCDIIRKIEQTLNENANLNDYEKQKVRVDYLIKGGRYAQGLWEYDKLLDEIPLQEAEMIAKINHNKGVALCGLFLYGQAAESFQKSYDMIPSEETYLHYLAAKRMELGDEEYISFVAQMPEVYEPSLILEQQIGQLREEWEASSEKEEIEQLEQLKQSGDMSGYYEQVNRMVKELKSTYRLNAGE